MPHPAVHVRVSRGTTPGKRAGTCVHWTSGGVERGEIDDPETAVRTAIGCLDHDAAVVAIDSALNRGLISETWVREICSLNSRGRRIARNLDPASESGIETLARLRLRRHRLRVRSQVVIGESRVDLLIGDRLILELDGRAWHDRPGDFEADRRRDRDLLAAGYLVMRASYRQVMAEFPLIEQQILALVRSRKHERRSRVNNS